jgi:DNA glycosylase AlkZ-like
VPTRAPAQPGPPVPLGRASAFVLGKQGLAGPGLAGLDAAGTATAGVYSTAPTCYLSFAARVPGFHLRDLDAALYEQRRLVRVRCMRESSYVVPAGSLPVVVAATTGQTERVARRYARSSGLDDAGFDALGDAIERAMAGRAPVTKAEVRSLLGPGAPASGVVGWAVACLCAQARLVRAEVRGGWRSDTYAYACWADWLGAPLRRLDPAAARVELARAYLRAFGPATSADLAWWSGWGARDTAAAVAALGDEVAPVSLYAPDLPEVPALVLADEAGALAASQDAAEGVRLLPVWDTYLMGYARGPAGRRPLVRPGDYERVYDLAGNGTSVLLVDGTAAGVWELAPAAGRDGRLALTVAPFGPAGRALRTQVEAVATRLASQTGHAEAQVTWAAPTGRLAAGARNAFLAPVRLGGT